MALGDCDPRPSRVPHRDPGLKTHERTGATPADRPIGRNYCLTSGQQPRPVEFPANGLALKALRGECPQLSADQVELAYVVRGDGHTDRIVASLGWLKVDGKR